MDDTLEQYKETFRVWCELSSSDGNGPETKKYIETLKQEMLELKMCMSLEQLALAVDWLKEYQHDI